MIMVPIDTLKMLRVRAAEAGTTVRALVLKSLRESGYSVPPDEVVDRRRRLRDVGREKKLSVRRINPRRTAY